MSQSLNPASAVASSKVPEFSRAERAFLLGLAHEAIAGALAGREIAREPLTPRLAEPRGVFTTIYCRGNLRGCIGHVLATAPLYLAVTETACAAALQDPRFAPVGLPELGDIRISLSVLSELFPIRAEEVEVGKHGLLITYQGRRGLLLPQVPVEQGWERETFLQQTCRKARVPEDAWRHGALLQAFTSETFQDPAL
ncbi:MAG: AmmeMemoRadiSam system protein A [Acidobacteria bacterium]|nr:AmmeMemoRadiSam system protein A [Acidobacteriota bacterium]